MAKQIARHFGRKVGEQNWGNTLRKPRREQRSILCEQQKQKGQKVAEAGSTNHRVGWGEFSVRRETSKNSEGQDMLGTGPGNRIKKTWEQSQTQAIFAALHAHCSNGTHLVWEEECTKRREGKTESENGVKKKKIEGEKRGGPP